MEGNCKCVAIMHCFASIVKQHLCFVQAEEFGRKLAHQFPWSPAAGVAVGLALRRQHQTHSGNPSTASNRKQIIKVTYPPVCLSVSHSLQGHMAVCLNIARQVIVLSVSSSKFNWTHCILYYRRLTPVESLEGDSMCSWTSHRLSTAGVHVLEVLVVNSMPVEPPVISEGLNDLAQDVVLNSLSVNQCHENAKLEQLLARCLNIQQETL